MFQLVDNDCALCGRRNRAKFFLTHPMDGISAGREGSSLCLVLNSIPNPGTSCPQTCPQRDWTWSADRQKTVGTIRWNGGKGNLPPGSDSFVEACSATSTEVVVSALPHRRTPDCERSARRSD